MSVKLTATKNYGLFDLLDFNRNVEKTKKLKVSMQNHGYLPAYPLHCVRTDNGKLRVKAGHHRLTVARELGIAVYYVVCDDTASIHELEASTNPWKLHHYLTSFCRCEMPEYKQVAEYTERTGINLQAAISMMGGHTAGSGNHGLAFKNGTYRVHDTEHAELVADLVLHCDKEGLFFAKNSLFVSALSRIAKVVEFDAEQFMRRVSANAVRMKRQPHLNGYLEMIESIYNRGSHEKQPLVFMATQAARLRQPEQFRKPKAETSNQPTET